MATLPSARAATPYPMRSKNTVAPTASYPLVGERFQLDKVRAGPRARGVAVLFHGGTGGPPRPAWSVLSYLRMTPIRWDLRRASRGRLAVVQVYSRDRGWAIDGRDGPQQARAVVAAVRERFPGLPVALVGHSSGGFAALRAAGETGVRCVVALAPWLSTTEPTEHLRGVDVLLVHSPTDQITSAAASRRYVARLAEDQVPAAYVEIVDSDHAMLRHWRKWHAVTRGAVLESLLGATER